MMGKGVGELAGVCKQNGVPCVGFGGIVPNPAQAKLLFSDVHALTPGLTTPQEAMGEPALWLEKLAAKAAAEHR